MKHILLALLLLPAVASAQHPRLAAIDSVFDMYRGTENPGCAVGVSRHGRVIHERGYGMANLETGTPIRPGSIFHVASVSKQFTAMAILLLERDGKLSLDDDIRKYVPEMPDYGTRITIRHLLQHTSGIRDQWELLILARGRFEENRITQADVMDIVPRQKALNFEPQSEYMYSNSGYTLAAVIVRRVSGKSLRDFADERIFQPLGMRDTHFHDDYTMIVPNRAWAYAPRQGGELRASIPNYDTYGATSLFTTVGDLLTWQANFDSLRVGDRGLFDAMQGNTVLTNGDSTGYGLGVSLGTTRGARLVGHGGADAGYRSWTGRYPDHGLGIAIACNVATANPGALASRVAEAVLRGELAGVAPAGAPAAAPSGAAALSAEQVARHAGVYFAPQTQQTLELVARDSGLFVGRTGNARLAPAEEGWLRAAGAGATSPRLRFVDANRLELGTASSNRVLGYERRREAVLTLAALAAYAGEYYSAELNATYRVTVQDTTIVFQTGTADPVVARPLFLDAFAMRGTAVVFTRSGNRVTGFEASGGRVRRVGFTRTRN